MEIYFDGELINNDSYTGLTNTHKLFDDSFYLGAVVSNTFKLSVDKSAVSQHPSKVVIDDGNTIYHLIVDNIEEDKYSYIYTLVDALVNLNFNYDASEIITEKAELEEECLLSDILADICEKAELTLDSNITWLNDFAVTWYDNTILAREYVSMIAELQGGYAYINADGELSIKQHKTESIKTIDIDECSDFVLGEKKVIRRVVYDNTSGIFYEYKDEENEGNTIYINPKNVYVIDESIIENIFNSINGFEFYSIDVPNAPMDSSVKAGDVITFTDGENDYPTIAQYQKSYNGGWIGGYSLQVNSTKQEETQMTGLEQKVLSIQTQVNRNNATLTTIAQQVEGNTSNITTIQTAIDSFSVTVEKVDDLEERTTELEVGVEGLDTKLTQIGGQNMFVNPVGLQDRGDTTDAYGWVGVCKAFTNTEIKNTTKGKSVLVLMDGTRSQTVLNVTNGTYTVSFLYKKLISLAECKLTINGHEIELDSESWKSEEYTFSVNDNTIVVELESDTDDACYLGDLMLNTGDFAKEYSSNATEVVTDTVKIGAGIEVRSNIAETYTRIDTDGNRTYNIHTNEVVNESTKDGAKGKKAIYEESEIANVINKRVGNQTWEVVL